MLNVNITIIYRQFNRRYQTVVGGSSVVYAHHGHNSITINYCTTCIILYSKNTYKY